MIDIRLLRSDPDLIRENIKKKFQDEKLPLVDEVIALDERLRQVKREGDDLRRARNEKSDQVGGLLRAGKRAEAEALKAEIGEINKGIAALGEEEKMLSARINEIMLVIPNIIDPSVPIGRDDSENVERERFLEPRVPDFPIPYHVDIIERLGGIDLEAARRVSGNGFYYLIGDFARLHSAILIYARDFMIDRGFTYCIPPFMIRGRVVNGVMSLRRWTR